MFRTLLKSLRENKKNAILTPILVSCEVVIECIIPMVIANLVNDFERGGDRQILRILGYGGIVVILAILSLAFGTAAGTLFGKLMCKLTGGKVNPLIGSAGVSAVPMAARVSQKVGAEADPTNFLLMHAMGPNVAGVIGTAVAAGAFMAMFGVF